MKNYKIALATMFILGGGVLKAQNDTLTIASYAAAKQWELKKTPSGICYHIEKEGKGKQPSARDYVRVQYTLRLLNDKVIEAAAEPFAFQVGMGQVMEGWDEGMTVLREGAKATFLIPPSLAYGTTGADEIPPNAPIVLEVSLEGIMNQFEYEQFLAAQEIKEKQAFSEKSKSQHQAELSKINEYAAQKKWKTSVTGSGLTYVITKKGNGAPPKTGQNVVVRYEGMLLDGTYFDKHLEPYTFRLGSGKLLDGWEEGLRLLPKGTEGYLIFPSKLGFEPIQLNSEMGKNWLQFLPIRP